MRVSNLVERVALAAKLRSVKLLIAESVTKEFFKRHPDWVSRYGDRGRKLGIEDACFHIEFLAGAVEAGSITAFQDYVHWTKRMLGARMIAGHFLAENLKQIESALSQHLTVAEGAFVAEYVRVGRLACSESVGLVPAAADQTERTLASNLFLQAITTNQRKAAATIVLEALRSGSSPTDIYVDILQESLYEVGKMWEANLITVAEEHTATAIAQYVMAQLYAHLPPATQTRGNVLITGVAGELHQIGANMVADVLDAQGYDVRFLGTNMPHSGIVQAIEEHDAAILGISATMLFNIPQVVELVSNVRSKLGERSPKIILGGAAFRSLPSLPVELGAIGSASDIRSAVRMLG